MTDGCELTKWYNVVDACCRHIAIKPSVGAHKERPLAPGLDAPLVICHLVDHFLT
jgi:hypothetical protein